METTTYKKNADGDLEETTIVVIPKEDIEQMKVRITELQNKIDAHNQQNNNDIAPFQAEIDTLNLKISAAEDHGVIAQDQAVPLEVTT